MGWSGLDCVGEENKMLLKIRPLHPADWPAVRRIYKEGITTGNATFEQAAPDWEEWDTGKLTSPRLAAEVDGAVLGWAALSDAAGTPRSASRYPSHSGEGESVRCRDRDETGRW